MDEHIRALQQAQRKVDAALTALDTAVEERSVAVAALYKAGWTVRRIAAAAGISPTAAWRSIHHSNPPIRRSQIA
jgi:hypothetical protein